jgi:hypothetical protein
LNALRTATYQDYLKELTGSIGPHVVCSAANGPGRAATMEWPAVDSWRLGRKAAVKEPDAALPEGKRDLRLFEGHRAIAVAGFAGGCPLRKVAAPCDERQETLGGIHVVPRRRAGQSAHGSTGESLRIDRHIC